MVWGGKSADKAVCAAVSQALSGRQRGRSSRHRQPGRHGGVAASGPVPGGWWSGEDPCPVAEGQAAADEVAQVEGGGAVLEPGVVAEGAAVAEFEAPPAAADDLGDDPLNIGAVLAVVLAEGWLGSPVRPGSAKQRVVLVQDQGAAMLVRGAAGSRGRRRRRSHSGGR